MSLFNPLLVKLKIMLTKNNSLKKVSRQDILAVGHIVPEEGRCVQCGICTFNCPIGIDVRRYAGAGKHVVDLALPYLRGVYKALSTWCAAF